MKALQLLWATRSFHNIKEKITAYGNICWKLARTWKLGILRKVFDLLLEKHHLCLCLSDDSSLLHGSSRLFPLDWTCVIAFLGSGQFQALHLLLETVTYFVVQIVLSWFCSPNFSSTFRLLHSRNIVIRLHPRLWQSGICRLTNCISL